MKPFGHKDEGSNDGGTVVRHQDELEIGTRQVTTDSIGITKTVETQRYEDVVPRDIEHADTERVPVTEGDSGDVEYLADGSVSVPVFEERVVVTKELVVRERIIVRKRTVSEQYRIEADLRSEHVEVEADSPSTLAAVDQPESRA
ncbi:MAG: photosystem reaction center protein [Thermoleophilia bacterium]|nr:photosystem reaction center protein [Thermoleophilia bacterium]